MLRSQEFNTSWNNFNRLSAVLCMIFAAVACLAAEEIRPNIVVFVADDQSPDIGMSGNKAIKTLNTSRKKSSYRFLSRYPQVPSGACHVLREHLTR